MNVHAMVVDLASHQATDMIAGRWTIAIIQK